MKSDVERQSETHITLTVEVPFDELTAEIDAAYKNIGSQVAIPGFRRGKVPRQIIDQRVGRGAVLEEVVNAAVPTAYDSAIDEAQVNPIGQPKIEITEIADGERITFTAEVDIRPEFELPQYKELQVSVPPLAVTDADVDEQVTMLAKRFGSLQDVDRPVQDGDVLVVDISGAIDGQNVEELSANAMSHEMGEDGLLPGADEALIGTAKGDTATFVFTPEFGDHEGQAIEVSLVVNEIRERLMPEIDDELAMMASEFDTLEELREDIRTRLDRARLAERGAEAREKLHDQLLDSIDIPLPEGVIAAEVEGHFEDHGPVEDGHREEVEADARKALKSQLILDKIAEAEEVTVGEAELSQWLMMQAPQYGMSADAFAQALVEAGQVPAAVTQVRNGKALALVLQSAIITDTDGNPIDLSPLDRRPSQPDTAAALARLATMQGTEAELQDQMDALNEAAEREMAELLGAGADEESHDDQAAVAPDADQAEPDDDQAAPTVAPDADQG